MNQQAKDVIASTVVSFIFLLCIVALAFAISYMCGFMAIVFGFAALKAIDFFTHVKNIIVRIYKS